MKPMHGRRTQFSQWTFAAVLAFGLSSLPGTAPANVPAVKQPASAKAATPAQKPSQVSKTVRNLLQHKKPTDDFEKEFRQIVSYGEVANPALLKIAGDEDYKVDQRWVALRAVGRIGDKSTVPELLRLAKDPFPTIRMGAIRALGDMGAEEALPDLRERAENDKALLVRNTAVQVLGQMKSVESLPTLERVFYDERNYLNGQSLFIRRHAIEAIGRLESRMGAPLLIKALDDRDTSIHPVAVSSLERITGLKFASASTNPNKVHEQWKRWWEAELQRIPVLPQ